MFFCVVFKKNLKILYMIFNTSLWKICRNLMYLFKPVCCKVNVVLATVLNLYCFPLVL